MAENVDLACFLLARIGLTGNVLTDNSGASVHYSVNQKNAIRYHFSVEIIR